MDLGFQNPNFVLTPDFGFSNDYDSFMGLLLIVKSK